MKSYSMEPEYILEESEKTVHMERLPDSLGRDYLALLADSEVLYREFERVLGLLGNITKQLRMLELSVSERE